jgi:predicted nucleic acid-binding protein
MVIADTSFVVAVAIRTDQKHSICFDTFKKERQIYLPQSTFAEIAFMLTRAGGIQGTSYFFLQLPKSRYIPVPLQTDDYQRTADLLDKYADSRVDFVDASIAAVAERLNITRILTLDRRDFQILRPQHIDRFEILPP